VAHSSLHFTLGWVIGSLVFFLSSLKLWLKGSASAWFKRWYIWSLSAGLFATIPELLLTIGIPADFCSAWWMNIFFFSPLLDNIKPGGVTLGPLLMAACLGGQYLLLIATIIHLRHTANHKNP
jgi:hypothetical protein